jgi:PhnB protein
MQVQPYLDFNGRCDEAIEFYKKTIGAKVTRLMRWSDCPDRNMAQADPKKADKVMHARMSIGESIVMASDGRCGGSPVFSGISLSLSPPNDAEAERMFAALSEGGKVTMPIGKTFFASKFGMVTDRFGVSWMVVVEL